jgi:mono/diheme cytochrome c family protein
MRHLTALVLALAALGACNRAAEEKPAAAAGIDSPFDGAGYRSEAEKVAHGQRLATLLDCTGCHKADLRGQNVTADEPDYGQMNAPNITLLLAKYTDADFDRLIRHGVPKDKREFWFMPVESFQFLTDSDLAAIIAFLRSHKPAGTQLPPIVKGKGFYEDLKRGFGNARQQVARYQASGPAEVGAPHERGRMLVRTVCTSCHNGELQGYKGFTPNLDIAGAYSKPELLHLLTTGQGKTKKNLGMMSDMAREHFSKLTPGEREAMVDYLLARANRPQ